MIKKHTAVFLVVIYTDIYTIFDLNYDSNKAKIIKLE